MFEHGGIQTEILNKDVQSVFAKLKTDWVLFNDTFEAKAVPMVLTLAMVT
jgi:hypothetical protein